MKYLQFGGRGGKEGISSLLYSKCLVFAVLLQQVEQNQWGANDPQHAYKLWISSVKESLESSKA